MSLLVHAKRELELAGLFDKDSDYEGMLGESTMRLIKTFSEEGHSGFSAGMAIHIFHKLANFENLTPITDSKEDWMDVSEYGGGDKNKMWQCRRNSSLFSTDGGKTYYDVNDNERKTKESVKEKEN